MRDYIIYLNDILSSINKIEKAIKNVKSFQELDEIVIDGILRNLEIVGEAAKNLPEEFKNLHKDVPWKEIVALRNILVHEYFGIDYEIIWNILIKDLPNIKPKIERLIKKLGVNGKVMLLGQKSHNETLSIIASCDVLILPSKSETFSNIVLEGLALEKPVISTKVGGVPEMKSKNLYLLDDLEAINQILEKGIEPKEDNRVLEMYSMDKIIGEFEGLFEKTVRSLRKGQKVK